MQTYSRPQSDVHGKEINENQQKEGKHRESPALKAEKKNANV